MERLKTWIADHRVRGFIVICCLFIVYTISRCVFLTSYPIFNDEGIYLRYGQASIRHQLWLYSLVHSGKQPLMYWLYGLMNMVVPDVVFAGRLVSVIIGGFSLLGMYILGSLYGSRKTGIIASLIYIGAPLFVFFDRIALVDTAITSIFIWMLVCIRVMVKKRRFIYALCIGILFGIGLWIKSTVILFIGVLVMLMLYAIKKYSIPILRAVMILLVVLITTGVLFVPLYMQEEFTRAMTMVSEYTYPLSDVLHIPIRRYASFSMQTILVYIGYVSPAMLFVVYMLLSNKQVRRKFTELFIAWVLPIIYIVMFSRSVHSRYVLFTAVPLVVMLAYAMEKYKTMMLITLLVMYIMSFVLIISPVSFFTSFPSISVYRHEAWQYVKGWPSGYGVREAFNYVAQQADTLIFLGVRWDSGNPEDQVLLYSENTDNITAGFLDSTYPLYNVVVKTQSNKPMYLITRSNQLGNFSAQKELVASFAKPLSNEAVEVYTIRDLEAIK
jgi:hypothetical protein